MPRAEDIAWKFVIRKGKKWRCPYCENEFSGSVTRVRSHFRKQLGEGIASCTKVPEHIRMLMESLHNQVHNKDDIAWKFVNRLGDNKWRCYYCSEEFFGDITGVKDHLLKAPNEGISICTKVPGHLRTLMLWLFEEVAEEESREANSQSSMEPKSRDMTTQAVVAEEESREANGQFFMEPKSRDMPTQAEVAEEESRETNSQFSTEPQSRDMPPPAVPLPPPSFRDMDFSSSDMQNFISDQQQGGRQFHQSSTMPLVVHSIHGNSNRLWDRNQLSQLQTPKDIDSSIATQQTSDSHIVEATMVDLQVLEMARNTKGPSSSQDMNRGSTIMDVWSNYANDEEMRNLKRKVEELDDKEAVIKEQMERESVSSSVQKKLRTSVERWLKETERARNNFQIIGQANAETLPPKEKVETLTRQVEELIRKMLPQTLLIEGRDAKGVKFLVRKLTVEAIRREIELIWDCLTKNHACKLGICGMGGIGKTTIMMHIHNRLLEDATFDGVAFITVSKDFSIYKLQSDIGKALKFDIMKDKHEKKRAAMLSEHLERKKNCVLILDDVWQHFKLEDVGIPDRAGVKVVLTTRLSEVCSRMDCEEIKIKPLHEEEAWKLFREELGPKPPTDIQVEKVARKIAKRCAGVPLAISIMASSMRGKKNIFVWQDTLNKMERSHTKHTEMRAKVLPVLTCSYECLSDPQVKQCFLFCALFPEHIQFRQMQLIEYFIDEGFLDEVDTREEQYYRGLAVVDMLQNACLLEVDHGIVSMHALIREMALNIVTTAYMVKAGQDLRRIPDGEYWTADLEKVSLMESRIEDIPPNISPNCPKLSTLLLNGSLHLENVQIQDSFFINMRGLKVLNLSQCGALKELPDSLSELANLRALLLRGCGSLCRIPYLGKLKFLRKLDVNMCSSLLEVKGLDELWNLRYLDLSGTGIERLLEGTLRRMVNLQYLKIAGKVKVKAEEVIQLKALERLESKFGNADDFNKYVRIIEWSGHYDYSLIVDQENSLWSVSAYVYSDPEILPENKIKDDEVSHHFCKSVGIESCNYTMARVGEERNNDPILIPGDVEFFMLRKWCGTNLFCLGHLQCLKELRIKECDNLMVPFGGAGVDEGEVRNISDLLGLAFDSLETLEIEGCSKLKYLFGHESEFSLPNLRQVSISRCEVMEGMTTSGASPLGCLVFRRLERINLENCGNVKRMVGFEWLPLFPNLTTITVANCNKIRELLLQQSLLYLQNLECIEVCDCEGIEEIISGEENHRGSALLDTPFSLASPFSTPKLKRLVLVRLPQLKCICEGAPSFFSEAYVELSDCPKLKIDSATSKRRVTDFVGGGMFEVSSPN